jgi:hypothetical protein
MADVLPKNIRIIHAKTGKTIRSSNRFTTEVDDAIAAIPDVEYYIESRLSRTPKDVRYVGPEWGRYEEDYYIGWVFSTEFEDQIDHCAATDGYGEQCKAYPIHLDPSRNRGLCGRHKKYYD